MRDAELNSLSLSLSKFVVGTEGNVSRKTKSGLIIKASGKSFIDNDYVDCDVYGEPWFHGEKPSMEVGFHSLIYRCSDYEVIAHTHPTNVMKILCGDRMLEFASNRLFPDQVIFNGPYCPTVPYATPGKDLTEAIHKRIGTYETCPNIFLLQNHGIICCGFSAKEVLTMTEICEKSAEIFLNTINPNYLTSEEILRLTTNQLETYRRDNLRRH